MDYRVGPGRCISPPAPILEKEGEGGGAALQEKNPLLRAPTTVSAISADDKQLEKPENKISLYAETF
jgi:hypothetical protein